MMPDRHSTQEECGHKVPVTGLFISTTANQSLTAQLKLPIKRKHTKHQANYRGKSQQLKLTNQGEASEASKPVIPRMFRENGLMVSENTIPEFL